MALPPPIKSLEDRATSELSDIYFDYDKSGIQHAHAALARDVEALRATLADFSKATIILAGLL